MTETGYVLVLREGVHGMPPADYADALCERLPDAEIRLAQTPAEERELVAGARVVTGLDIRPELLERAENLELFAGAYAGHGHLPLSELAEAGVAVTNASGVHAPNMAEHVVGFLLHFARGFGRAMRQGQHGEWRSFHTRELQGSTVGVVGLGAIGGAVCERLEPFGARTLGVRRDPSEGGPADEVYGSGDLHAVLAESDYLVLACPLTEETRGLIDREAIGTLADDAVLVNVARGEVVETDALVSALRRNHLGGAALDVTDPEPLPTDHPLWGLENVLVTPHNAGHTPRYYDRLADIVAENVDRLGSGERLRNQVVPNP